MPFWMLPMPARGRRQQEDARANHIARHQHRGQQQPDLAIADHRAAGLPLSAVPLAFVAAAG